MLALVFVTAIGLVIGFVLTYVETSFKYAATARTDRAELYAADGAMEAAIARVQAGEPCGDYEPPAINGVNVAVTCEPAPRPPPPPPELAPSPTNAILTLGPQGFHQLEGSDDVVVRGDVFSHSVVTNSSTTANLTVQGGVAAVGECSDRIITTPEPSSIRCSNRPPAADPADGPDPAYPSDLSGVPFPKRQGVPNCVTDSPNGWLVPLTSGYYDDAIALSRLTNDPTCAGKVVWFQPGVYYFDFNFSSTGTTCDQDPNLCTWQIGDPEVNVVGGQPLGWDPDLTARPTINLPGGCLRDEEGVQLIFGGQSRVEQTAGKVELCPRTASDRPPITLYGLDQGAAPERRVTKQPATVSMSTGFVTPENARAVAEEPRRLTADAALTSLLAGPTVPPPAPASLTLTEFDIGDVPEGSRVAEVRLRVVHRETGDVGGLKATVRSKDGVVSGSPFSVPRCAEPDPEVYCDFPIPLGQLSPAVMSSLSVTYEASPADPPIIDPLTGTATPKTGTESLDGIVLDVRFTRPALEALSGCLVQPYDPTASPATGCALFKTSGDRSLLSIGGTVYAPTGAVDLDLVGPSAPVLNRGIITSSLRIKAAAAYDGPLVALPEINTKRALLALRDGVFQRAGSGKTLIRGDVFSQSVVDNDSTAPLVVQGKVAAVGTCTGPIESDLKRCQDETDGPASPTEGTDPVFPPAVEIVPDRPVLPACGQDPVIALQPGYYDDASALSSLTTGGACQGKVVWMIPGVYYFDFNFGSSGLSCAEDASLCTWTIDDATLNVVGGEIPKKADGSRSWDEDATARPEVNIPGGCTDESGVQLIFGGESRLHQKAGNVELCPYRKSKLAPAISLYGLARGTAHEQARSFSPTASSGVVNFSNPPHAYEINEEPTRLTADSTSPALTTSGTITVSGFAPEPGDRFVPEGGRFVSASLRIAHRETALSGLQTVTVADAAGNPLTSATLARCTDFCEQRIPLPGITTDQLPGIKATYQVALTGVGPVIENLDGIELEVRSTPPSFQALSGCLVASPGCALVKAEGAGSKLVLNGTVYAPTATLEFDLEKLSTPIVNDGIIAGAARLKIQPSACYTGPVISHLDAQFPSELPEPGRVFTACIDQSPVLRARVTFTETPPTVRSWSVLR